MVGLSPSTWATAYSFILATPSSARQRALLGCGANRAGGPRPRDLFAPVYGWFTEGFGTADLKDAAVLLSELA